MKRSLGMSVVLLAFAALIVPAAAAGTISLPEKSVEALLFLRHPRGLNRFVRAVSDPSSPRYRQYSNVATLVKRFGASAADRRQTLAWLARQGLHGTVGPTGAYVTVPIPPRRAARLLPRSAGAGASAQGAPGREVPAALRGPVTGVGILGNRRVFKNVTAAPSAGPAAPEAGGYSSILPHSGTASGCPEGRNAGIGAPLEPFTPNQYLSAYGHTAMHDRGLRGQGESMAVVEIDGFRHSDIDTFDKCFGLRTPPIRVVPVTPLTKPFPPGTETTLDLEVLSAGVPGVERIDVYEGYGTETGIMLTAGSALGSPGHRPDVISISLGICEPKYSGHLVLYRAMNSIFAVAAGAGISTLVSAGDTGSSGCRVETKAASTALPVKAVSLPSSSPYVTAVGGTNLRLTAKNRIRSEIVWNDWPELAGGGGGGTSLLSPRRPWWQQAADLARYKSGRIVPDISALADVFPGFAYYCTAPECAQFPHTAPGWTSIGGTSAAAPLMASGVVLADQFAARHQQRSLGFLNPLLYHLGNDPKARRSVFRDVSKGNDDIGALLPQEAGGGHPLGCCGARPGYDWASGWGSLKVLGLARAAARAAP